MDDVGWGSNWSPAKDRTDSVDLTCGPGATESNKHRLGILSLLPALFSRLSATDYRAAKPSPVAPWHRGRGVATGNGKRWES